MAKKYRGKNEGTIYQKPNGKWRAQISFKGHRISHTANTKAECLQWLRKKQSELDMGFDPIAAKMPVGEYLAKWLENYKASLRPNTAYQYEVAIRLHIVPFIGKVQIGQLKPLQLEQFYARLIQLGRSPRTVRVAHSILHNSLKNAVRYGVLIRNPAEGAVLPRKRKQEMRVWDDTQVNEFLIAAQGSRYEAFYHLAVKTGMRQAELLGLQWADIHWTKGILHVRRQAQRLEAGGWHFIEPKTKNGTRSIRLGEGTLQVLREQREAKKVQKAVAGLLWRDLDLIFTSNVGTPIDRSNMRLDFNRIIKATGLPKIRFHDLRHTAASLMLNHNIPVIVVSRILGHSKPSITLDIYGHLYNEMQEEAARLMDELVTPIRVEITTGVLRDGDEF